MYSPKALKSSYFYLIWLMSTQHVKNAQRWQHIRYRNNMARASLRIAQYVRTFLSRLQKQPLNCAKETAGSITKQQETYMQLSQRIGNCQLKLFALKRQKVFEHCAHRRQVYLKLIHNRRIKLFTKYLFVIESNSTK